MSEVVVTLPDGSTLSVEKGATVEEVAYEIGPGLGADTVAGKIDGELVDKQQPITDDCRIEIVTAESEAYLRVLRHTAAHVFAQALQERFPDAKLAIGPPTDDGFYYDITGIDLDSDDLDAIEDRMDEIIAADYPLKRIERDRTEAFEIYADNPYKQEILDVEAAGEDPVTFYEQNGWFDLCQGPHVESTGEIGAIKLLTISASYWRGDEDNDVLTRVYGTAFKSQAELDEFLKHRAEAEKRDHRRIGQQLDLFSIPEITGPGLPLYHPNGKAILRELEQFVDELNSQHFYKHVETPHLFRTALWKQSGHYENYVDDMFLLDVNDEEYGLKPMNCPGHATIFNQRNWSYRDLPVRYAEDGKVYRKEQRGELSGLSRVWAFTIDDGHLFIRPDQIESEVKLVLEQIFEVLDTFGLEYEIALATRPEKSIGSDAIWEEAETKLESVLESLDIEYDFEPGDGAFYGPKIDFTFEDALGRNWDGPTVQLDFNIPDRFDLTYTGQDNEEHQVVMIHRALYGSYERFFMVLIEHFYGKFPTWLAPEQVRILPVSDDDISYAETIQSELHAQGVRIEIEDRSWTVGKKIQTAHDDQVPYMLVVGSREADAGTVSVRDRFEREVNDIPRKEFYAALEAEIEQRTLEPQVLADE